MNLRRVSQSALAGSLLLSAGAYLSFTLDGLQLRETARRVVGTTTSATNKTLALLDWVHAIPQTAENRRYFLIPRLRATPMQVLESGGDCADKSRLLTALLREVGVGSTMVMLFDPRSGHATHTVVCAFLEIGSTMVVDPAYGLSFPDGDTGRYLGLAQLRRHPARLDARLRELRATAGRRDPVQVYDPVAAGYAMAGSVNWNKNALTRGVRDVLLPSWGEGLYAMARPRALEEPKLLVAGLGLALALSMLIVRTAVGRVRKLASSCVPSAERRPEADHSAWKAVGI